MCPLEIETISYYKPIDPHEVCVDPYTTHSPQKGMCPLGIEIILGSH